ncbi:DUF5719 family protein [Ornithinimicrobium sp. Y1694]|uniref:DUF5719 family protein n=1 Tax=Ornithinimicrobium sp. Y1694 TaxID=3418590 RepID=UPI003CF557AA
MSREPEDNGAPGAAVGGDGAQGAGAGGGAAAAEAAVSRRALPWWRPTVAVLAAAGLVWGAGWLAEGGVQLGSTTPSDSAEATTNGPVAYVESASLACPGPVPGGVGTATHADASGASGEEDDGDAARALVVAASAPAEVGEFAGQEGAAEQDSGVEGVATGESLDARGSTGEGSGPMLYEGDGSSDAAAGGASGGSAGGDGSPLADLTIEADAAGLVAATGAGAPGVVGGQLSLSTEPGARGLSLTGCGAAAETQWLVAGGHEAGRSEHLVLSNPGENAVTVDVAVYGADGLVTTTGASGLVVPAHGRSVHLLDALAPSVEAPVVQVRASGGPVVAHLAEYHREGTTDLGAEIVGAAAAPSTDLVIPAMLLGGENGGGAEAVSPAVTLRLVAPGDSSAVVDLTALTPDGAVRLSEDVTRVPAGTTVDVVLEDLPDQVNALRVRSASPVTGGLKVELPPSGDEPVEPGDDAATTGGPDGAAVTGGPDDAATTAGPDDAATTAGPDDAATTAEPDDAATTAGPDGASTTAGPPATPQAEPLVRPAGELAWVPAVTLSTTPIGMGIPDLAALSGGTARVAVTVLDATPVRVTWLLDDGTSRADDLDAAGNDTTVVLGVPTDARAVWVEGGGEAGVVASLVVTGQDLLGPYLAAAPLTGVPWERSLTSTRVLTP